MIVFFTKAANEIRIFMKRHCLALIFAILVGVISIAPYLLAAQNLGENYKGLPFLFQSNEDYYFARIQEIVDGHGLVGSPFLYEYKELTPMVFPIGEYFYALPAIIFSVSVETVVIASKCVFPAILFFLIYFLIYQLASDSQNIGAKVNAVAGGLLITLGYDFVCYKLIWSILSGLNQETYLMLWTRPVNPVVGGLLLFIFLLLLLNIIKKTRRFLFLPAGLILGLMSGYFFSWILALTVAGVLAGIFLFKKEYRIAGQIFLIILLSAFFIVPLIYSTLNSLSATNGAAAALRNGLQFTHRPIWNKFVIVNLMFFLPLFLYEWYKSFKIKQLLNNWWWFCFALLASSFIIFNQQIITGRTIWPPHFVQYTIPLAMVVEMNLLNYFRLKRLWFWKVVVAIIFISTLTFGISIVRNYSFERENFLNFQQYSPLFEWLEKNAKKDDVALTIPDINFVNDWIPAFTSCNVYSSAYAFSRIPEERNFHNFLVQLRLRDVEAQTVKSYLLKNAENIDYVKAYFYTNWDQRFRPTDESWLKEPIDKITVAYQEFVQKDLTSELKKYRIDYIVSEKELSLSVQEAIRDLNFLGKMGSIYLYQL